MKQMTTMKEAKALFGKIGISISKTEYDEYRVNFKGGREGTAYYSTDIADAIDTGLAMASEKVG